MVNNTMDTQSNSTNEENSAVPTTYSFQAYDSGTPAVPATGNRIAKCLYRSDSKDGLANSYIELPELSEDSIKEQMTVLLPHVVTYLESVQDEIVKTAHKGKYEAVQVEAVSLESIITRLESAGEGRLNKEQVFAWFDESLKDMLIVAFADKLGLSDEPSEEEAAKLDVIVDTYRIKYGALAGGKSRFMPEEAEKLKAAIEVAEAADTSLGVRFIARLNKMQEPEKDLLLSL